MPAAPQPVVVAAAADWTVPRHRVAVAEAGAVTLAHAAVVVAAVACALWVAARCCRVWARRRARQRRARAIGAALPRAGGGARVPAAVHAAEAAAVRALASTGTEPDAARVAYTAALVAEHHACRR